jgi:hypothetical protein
LPAAQVVARLLIIMAVVNAILVSIDVVFIKMYLNIELCIANYLVKK